MKKILVSQAIYIDTKRKEYGDKLDSRIIKFLQVANYLPIPVSNYYIFQDKVEWKTHKLESFLKEIEADGVLLTGGTDLGTHKNRDLTEEILLAWSVNRNVPALGLCRGMQLMGRIGGALLEEVTNHVQTYHTVSGQISDSVNSYHNYAFKSLPQDYKVLSTTSDGVIEAFRHTVKQWEGWMWHPEREKDFRVIDIERTQEVFG